MSERLPKYAREYYDKFLSYLCNSTMFKKKELLNKVEKLSIDDFKRCIGMKVLSRNRDSLARAVQSLDNEIDTVYCFNSGLHFCVTSLPDEVSFNAFTDGTWDKDIFIDFVYEGADYFLHAWKCTFEKTICDVESCYQVMLFANRPEMWDYNLRCLQNQYDRLWEFSKIYKLHISADASDYLTEVTGSNFWLQDKAICKKRAINKNVDILTTTDEHGFSELRVPSPEDLIKLINHVEYCYLHRDQLTRKNGKVKKKYDACKVHTAHSTESAKDVYVPLTTYHASERKSGEYKGGHHSSPREHDRRAFYRRSRGRGNYDLVDGKIVYVGDMKGKYSLVQQTHVAGEKSKALKIYRA